MTLPLLLALDVAPYPLDPGEVVQSASNAPIWLWLGAGSCCVLTAAVGVIAVAALGCILLRRRKK